MGHFYGKYYQKMSLFYKKMLKSKTLNYDRYLRIVSRYALPQFYPKFGYRVAYAPLLSSYWGESQGLSPTYEQAHVGLDLFTLVS